MKKTIITLLAIFFSALAFGQTLRVYPNTIQFTTPSTGNPTPQTVNITGSGLTPSSGYVVVNVPVKFVYQDGSTWSYDNDTIPYSGGTISASVTLNYAGPGGFPSTMSLLVSGGGAGAEICACMNNTSCPCAPLSVGAVSHSNTIVISPNPATDELNVSASSTINSISISNLIGNTVYRNTYSTDNVRVDISSLPQGIYLLKINNEDVRKFIKQ